MKKQLMALTLIIATFLCFATVSATDTQKEISLYVNGEKIHSEVPPQIINGTTLVPLRVIFEALGATVEWDNTTKTVSSTLGEEAIKLTIGDSSLYKNGNAISGANSKTYYILTDSYTSDYSYNNLTVVTNYTATNSLYARDLVAKYLKSKYL